MTSDLSTPVRALRATEAGVELARLIGLDHAISARRMWALARSGTIPCIRINRIVLFQTTTLRGFAETGGTASVAQKPRA